MSDNSNSPENGNRNIGVVICIAKNTRASSTIYVRNVDENNQATGIIFQLRNRKQESIWLNDDVSREDISFGSFVEYIKDKKDQNDGDYIIYCSKLKLKPKNIVAIQMEFDFDGESAVHGITDIFPSSIIHYRNLHVHVKDGIPKCRTVAVSMKRAEIKDEKIHFTTQRDEVVDMRLLCRENLQLSTSSMMLQLKDTTGDDDVGDMAVVKFVPKHSSGKIDVAKHPRCVYHAVCVGLLLKFKPTVISIEDEPVKIRAGNGSFIPVPGDVLFDTGNLIATGISKELLNKLDLKEDRTKLRKVKLPDGKEGQFGSVPLQIVVRGKKYKVNALVGAPATGTDLLIGIDIIKRLKERKFTFGD